MSWQGQGAISEDEAGAEAALKARRVMHAWRAVQRSGSLQHAGAVRARWPGSPRTGEDEAGAAGDDEEEAGDARTVGGLGAAPAQLLQLVHHVLAAGLKGPQVLLQACVHHAHHAAASTQPLPQTAPASL